MENVDFGVWKKLHSTLIGGSSTPYSQEWINNLPSVLDLCKAHQHFEHPLHFNVKIQFLFLKFQFLYLKN